jgi:hypothetical protein
VSTRSDRRAAEQRHLDEIVGQLRDEGWAVITEPGPDSLPEALSDRQVDFIARRGQDLLIGEVASRSSARKERIDLLARRVEQIPNARLQVYWLGDSPKDKPDFHQVGHYIQEASAVAELSAKAGLLMAMAALEGATAAFAERNHVDPQAPARQLFANLYSLGLFDESDFNRVTHLYRLRSEIAHSATPREPELGDIEFSLDLAERMLSDRYISADRITDWFANLDSEKHAFVIPVPWVTISPDLIERIIAVLLGNLNSQATRIRPSQGDGGVDVLVPTEESGHFDVYQVKSFATRLKAGQKRQIRESLVRAHQTHNDLSNHVLIDRWLLTLPLDPTPQQLQWLTDEAADLKVPFRAEWRGLTFLDGLAAQYPQVIDYYLRDGKDRLQETIAILRDLANLEPSATGATVEPQDVSRQLGDIFQALNREDPHYRYDFEVTARPPIYFERPYLVASVTDTLPGQYITHHIYARYADAPADRPIPITFQISREQLTPEASNAVEEMLRYGTPVDLPASAITNLRIELPAGLGFSNATGSVRLGPTRSSSDQPSRVVWAIVSAENNEPLTQLTFQMETVIRGQLGGLFVRGTDSTGVVAVTIRVDPPQGENPTIGLSVTLIDPTGKPVQQALPGLRFLRQFHAPNRLAFGPEYGSLTTVETPRLPEDSEAIPASLLDYAEALDAISRISEQPISAPDFAALADDEYRNVVAAAKLLGGEHVRLTWSSITARVPASSISPDQVAMPQSMMTAQDLNIEVAGAEHRIGRVFTYLLSANITGDLAAEPGPDGNIEITIVPGENDEAVMTTEALSPPAVQGYSENSRGHDGVGA